MINPMLFPYEEHRVVTEGLYPALILQARGFSCNDLAVNVAAGRPIIPCGPNAYDSGALKYEAGQIELIGSILAWILLTMPLIEIRPEIIDVYSRGSIALTDGFDCRDIKRSSIIERVCYLEKQRYLVINIKGTYRQYCDVSASTYVALMGAFSMGHYFEKEIDPGSNHDQYTCGTLAKPLRG